MPWAFIVSSTRLRRASASFGFCTGSKAAGEAMMPASIADSAGVSTAAQRGSQPGWLAAK